MAKSFSVAVEINGKIGASFSRTMASVEGRLNRLSNAFKANAIVAKGQMSEIAESYKGIAKMAAAGGIVFSVKHAFKDGEELAHELSNMKSAGRTVEEVAEGLREANKTIAEMPTATLANSVKLLNETTGAYGDFKHAVENLAFNSKLGDVLKNVVGVEDPAHELGSLVKALEIRTSASNPQRYKSEAAKLGQAELFYGGRLRADQFRDFASNSTVGVKQLDERFLTRIAPALIQEQTGEKVGTGLTAFRTIISGRKITDKKQAEAWQKLGLLNPKDVIKNKMGDVTGWKDGAIKGTATAYADPFEFMERVILPRLKAQGVDINDQMKLGQALNTLFKNNKAASFVSSISTAADRLRLHKDEALMNGVLSIDDIYDSSLLNDPKMASFAIKSAMTNIGSALTLPLMKPFAQTMVSIARAVNHLSAALIDHPEIAAMIAKLGAALLTWQAIRFGNLVFGVTDYARSIANLTLAASTGLAARLAGISRAIVTFSVSGRLAASLRALAAGLYAVTLGAPAYLANRLRSIAGGIMALQAVGGSRLVLATMAGSLAGLGKAVMAFPLMALRGIAVGMWALVANPVGLVLTGIVAGLTALGVWVYNNWGGIVSFFGAFGDAFMGALGPRAAGAIGKVIDWLGDAWRWVSNLLGPLDATGAKWRAWGEWAGKGVGTAVNALVGLPGVILDFAQKAWDALVNFDWASAGASIAAAIAGGLCGLATAPLNWLKGKLGIGSAAAAPMPKLGTAAPLQARALGGPVTRGVPYLVGERGPEIFVPERSGVIETHGTLKALASTGRSGSGALAIGIDTSAIDEAGRKAKQAGRALHDGLGASVMPIVFTGSIDEAGRRAEKLRATLAAIKASSIVLGDDRNGVGSAGGGSALGDVDLGPAGNIDLGPAGGASGRDGAGGFTGGGFGGGGRGRSKGGSRRGGSGNGVEDAGARLKSTGRVAGDMMGRAARAIARLKAHGWTDESAASAIGQAMQESGVRSDGPLGDTKRFGYGDDAAHGMFQWRAQRFRNLKAFAEKRHKDWKDFDTQVDFFDAEARKSYHGNSWSKVRSVHEGNIYGKRFEGYGDNTFGIREANAERALRHFRAHPEAAPEMVAAPKAPVPPKAPLPTFAQPSTPPVKIAGARAMGGPVSAGLSYLVGERGPEIFTPGAAGGISTNDALGRLADVGRAVTSGEGGAAVAPSPERIAKARSSESKPSGGRDRSFHAGEHHWHIDGGGDPREIRRQVEGCMMDFIRSMESAQSGSLND